MRLNFLVSLGFSAFFLVGCAGVSSLFDDATKPPPEAKLILKTTANGHMLFQCARDSKGFYWRFITPKATITDTHGNKIATQGADFAFTAPDGSRLRTKITAIEATTTNARLRDALFTVSPHGQNNGSISSYRWVRRTNAIGGIPSIACSKERLSQTLQVPFTAQYTFYR